MYQRFGTPGVAPADRFEFWRTWFSAAVDAPMQLEPVGRLPRDFEASAQVLSAGQADIMELRCGPAVGSWAVDDIAPAGRLRLAVLAPASGATGRWSGQEVSLERGAAAVLGRTDGLWRAPGGWRGIQVNVPRDAIEITDTQIEKINDPRLLSRNPALAGLVRPALVGMAGHLEALSASADPELGEVWVSLVTLVIRSLLGEPVDGTDTAAARRLQIQRHIAEHLADPGQSPQAIADALHISRRTLYAALPPGDGGVAAEIRRQRLARAHQVLSQPGQTQTIAQIAAQVGLPSPAHFSRIFRAHYGISPRDLRAGGAEGRAKGIEPAGPLEQN